MVSKNLNNQNEKHFKEVFLLSNSDYTKEESTLNDDSFADITFDEFSGGNIKQISNKAFGKLQSETIKQFWCSDCSIENQLPNHIWSTLSRFKKLNTLYIGLNVTKIPSNAFNGQMDNQESMLETVSIKAKQNSFVIKSGAFHNLTKLQYLTFEGLSSLTFEKQVFNHKTAQNSSFYGLNHLNIEFSNSNLTGHSFEPGSSDGPQPTTMAIIFEQTKIVNKNFVLIKIV